MGNSDLAKHLKAEVIDIRQSLSPSVKKILIDANVLYFCYYDRFSLLDPMGKGPRNYQKNDYPSFFKKLLSSNTSLVIHKVGLLEFINTVERAELQILYCKVNKTSTIKNDFSPKRLRYNYSEKFRNIQGQIITYLHSIKKTFSLLNIDASIDGYLWNSLTEWQDSLGDVEDATMIAEAKREGIDSVLTDDSAFVTFNGIKLFTANKNAINAYEATKGIKDGYQG